MTYNACKFTSSKSLVISFAILTGDPHVIALVSAIDFLSLVSFRHAQLEWVIFITFRIISTAREVPVEHIAGGVDFALLSANDQEIFTS